MIGNEENHNMEISWQRVKRRTIYILYVYLNSKQIPYSNSVKYLGMHLDQRLTWIYWKVVQE